LGTLYLGLLGEFGRTVGAGLNAIETLTTGGGGGLPVWSPLRLGVNALDHGISSLMEFLQGLADASVASPDKVGMLKKAYGSC